MGEDATTFDVLVIGAGPGGIAAAVTAAQAGRRVGLVDEGSFAGGQIWRNRGEPPSTTLATEWLGKLESVEKRIIWLRQSRVIGRPAQSTLLLETPGGPLRVGWRSLILGTGARELFLPFPGWTLPGVVGAGGIQALVKQGLSVRGKRIVVAGTGPLLLAVASLLKASGAIVPVLLEQATASRVRRFAFSLVLSPAKLLSAVALRGQLLGTRCLNDSYPLSVATTPEGLRLQFAHCSRTETIQCDYLACGFHLIPNSELPQLLGCELTAGGWVRVDGQLRTTVSGIFAVGEVNGIGGVDKALLEGQIAAHWAVDNRSAAGTLARGHATTLRFARRLNETFALRPELAHLASPDTVVCRCEDVRLVDVAGALNSRDAKLQSRCGMGPCQGRICGPILQHICHFEPGKIRPPVLPTRIANLIAQ